jgi:hypothetical protein
VDVVEGIELLRQTAARLGSDLPMSFSAAPEEAISAAADVLPLSPDLRHAYEHGAPAGEFPSFVQLSELDRVDELPARQVGYAMSVDGEVVPEWNPSWIVIGAEDGDPFIAHVDRPGTPVSIAIHGTGTWKPLPVADSLGTFYALVATWSSLLIEDFQGSKLDEERDFEVKEGFWQAFDQRFSPVLTKSEIEALRDYVST